MLRWSVGRPALDRGWIASVGSRVGWFCWSLLALAWGSQPRADDGRRIALVIGNAAYEHAATLANPHSDAQAVAAALRRVGFTTVEVRQDVGPRGLSSSAAGLRRRGANGGTGAGLLCRARARAGGPQLPDPDRRAGWPPTTTSSSRRCRSIWCCMRSKELKAASARAARCLSRQSLRVQDGDRVRTRTQHRTWPRPDRTTRRHPRGLLRQGRAGRSRWHRSEQPLHDRPFAADRDAGAGDPVPVPQGARRRLAATGNQQEPYVYGSLGGEPYYLSPTGRSAGRRPERRDRARILAITRAKPRCRTSIRSISGDFPDGTFALLARNRLKDLQGPASPAADSDRQSRGGTVAACRIGPPCNCATTGNLRRRGCAIPSAPRAPRRAAVAPISWPDLSSASRCRMPTSLCCGTAGRDPGEALLPDRRIGAHRLAERLQHAPGSSNSDAARSRRPRTHPTVATTARAAFRRRRSQRDQRAHRHGATSAGRAR